MCGALRTDMPYFLVHIRHHNAVKVPALSACNYLSVPSYAKDVVSVHKNCQDLIMQGRYPDPAHHMGTCLGVCSRYSNEWRDIQ